MTEKAIKISPSLLSADFSRLKEEVQALESAGADALHFDIMDGQFVPNLTFGPLIVKSLRPLSNLPFEAHLMMKNVDFFIPQFCEAGADTLIIHPEYELHIHRSLSLIKKMGKKAGLALNPGTSPVCLDYLWDVLDVVLIMTVNPGFGGQSFLYPQLEKIKFVRKQIGTRTIDLQVDGGITPDTASLVIAAGANSVVAGSSVFKTTDYRTNIKSLRPF